MRSCLIIDANRAVRAVLRQTLEGLGFACSEAADGQAARATVAKAMPDAIILEWHLQDATGLEFLQALRGLPGGDKPVVLFCTAETEPTSIAAALAAGASEYIIKPFDAEILRRKLGLAGLL